MQTKQKKYDDVAYKNIQKLYINKKYQTAKKYLIEYVEKYPQDVSAKSLLSKLLIQQEEYEAAEKLLKNCIKHHPERMVFVKNIVILYMELEDYEKAYKYYKKLDYDICSELNKYFTAKLIVLRVLLWDKLNIEREMTREEGYLLKQYKEYNKDLAIEHICENHFEDDINKNNNKKDNDKVYLFYKTREEVEELYEKASKAISEGSQRTPKLDMLDFYNFKYEEVGKSNNEYTNVFRVVAIKNTNKIITMYPIREEHIGIVNDLEKEKEYTTGKVRTRKSQIEKFYEKYK